MTVASLEDKRKVTKEEEKSWSSYYSYLDGKLEVGLIPEMPPGKLQCKWLFELQVRKEGNN